MPIQTTRPLVEISALPDDALISAPEVQLLLNISRTLIWRFEKAGHLAPIRFGRLKRYALSEVRKLAQEGIRHD